ncbi:MAG: hypothetical protein L6R41_003693 [Letrouitia leprolyta]|nr:MAG: hypothetical protein L6R41_003693 [Letrouitia leprolyta]
MDPFRLLSRSTKLPRSSLSKDEGVPKVPSAVSFEHVETESQKNVHLSEIASKGKKRKRSLAHGNQTLQPFSTAHDGGIAIGVDENRISRFDDTFTSTKTTVGRHKEPLEVVTNADTFNRGEWRRVLKQNRIKVTLLAAGSGDGDEGQRKHERLSSRAGDYSIHPNKAHTQLTSRPLRSFKSLGPEYNVSRRLLLNLDAQGYTNPTGVQLGAIPILMGNNDDRGLQPEDTKGHRMFNRSHVDLLTIAPTGSGKTLAFLIHLMNDLREQDRTTQTSRASETEGKLPKAIILAPTHELVDQIVNEGKKLGSGTGIRISRMRKGMKLRSMSVLGNDVGNEDMPKVAIHDNLYDEPQESSNITADILVSTPMLLLQAAAPSPELSLAAIRYLVLDEADILLDPLFRHQTLDIWNFCKNVNLQASLWSATIGSSVESLAQQFIFDRRRKLKLGVRDRQHYTIRLVVGIKDSAVPNVSHQLVYTATERGKLMALRQLIHPAASGTSSRPPLQPPFLVFTQTISRAVALHSELLYDVPVEAGGSSRIAVLHSNLSDTNRSASMAGFRRGEIWILITTDLLARGVDFRGVNGVVNYDIPNTSGIYIHRAGRTGRQGRKGGVAVTLYTKEDIKYVKNVANVIAASEKQREKPRDGGRDGALQEWLLNALPDVSKKSRKTLKQRGVEARRTSTASDDGGKTARRMRISTKSGYDRRLEHNRKGADAVGQRQPMAEKSDEEWEGIEDEEDDEK